MSVSSDAKNLDNGALCVPVSIDTPNAPISSADV
jgi:hypothetical protein